MGKYSYLESSICIALSPNKLQIKIPELSIVLEFIQIYIIAVLCITEGIWMISLWNWGKWSSGLDVQDLR